MGIAVGAFAIIGGKDAPEDRFPWVAQLELDGGLLCGASLLRAQWVVTAAHCVTDEATLQPLPAKRIAIRLDSARLGSGGERTGASWVIPYPAFDDSGGAANRDLALVRLARPVAVEPVRLVSSRNAPPPGHPALVAGWGSNRFVLLKDEAKATPALKEASVRLGSDSYCKRTATESFDLVAQLCSYREGGEACHGDSGGPLFLRAKNRLPELLGVIHGGERHCFAGHPALYTKLTDGPMRAWLDGQLRAAFAPAVSCPDYFVRSAKATVRITAIRTNVGCAPADVTAADVSQRDECVEETPGGVNECDSGGFECATGIENGPAGVAFETLCEDGTQKIGFRRGATDFASGATYRMTFAGDGRPAAIGPFDIAAGDRSVRDLIRAFGRPDSTSGEATLCVLHWAALGLKAYAVDYGSSEACDPDAGLINALVMTSPRFATDRGLAAGMSEEDLLARHPTATTRGPPSDIYFDNERTPPGSLYSIHTVVSPIGFDGRYSSLKALVQSGVVVGLEVTPLLGGD